MNDHTDHTDESEIESLKQQNAMLQEAVQQLSGRIGELVDQLKPAPAPETPTEAARRMQAEQRKEAPTQYPDGSLTAQAQKMAADRPAQLAEMFRRRREGLPDEPERPAAPVIGLTAAAAKLRAQGLR